MLKKFIIKKYVMARSAAHAMRLERRMHADDCWIDEEWRKANEEKVLSQMGFSIRASPLSKRSKRTPPR